MPPKKSKDPAEPSSGGGAESPPSPVTENLIISLSLSLVVSGPNRVQLGPGLHTQSLHLEKGSCGHGLPAGLQ